MQSPGTHGAGLDLKGAEADLGVVAQHPSDQFRVKKTGLREPWQEHFLLDPEVDGAMLPPESKELVAPSGDVGVLSPTQALRGDQGLMVIA
jgi:hypothetical protein